MISMDLGKISALELKGVSTLDMFRSQMCEM